MTPNRLHSHSGRNGLLLALFLLCLPLLSFAQSGTTISGTVTDDLGDPLPGVTVALEGTSVGTFTDADGTFTLSVSASTTSNILVFSYLGFGTQKQTLDFTQGNQTINMQLRPDITQLDEIVVTGNSVSTSRKQLGNSIASLQAADLTNTGAVGVDQALSGKVAGALVTQNSGDPAGGISIRLRGASTISGSSDPLYIVDGVLVNNSSNQLVDLGGNTQNRLVDLNPDDIERIEIIKGAAAAAIYGSRASNGVVQIFTKRGKSGKPQISFTTGLRVNQLRKEIDYNTVPLAWEDPFDNNNLNTVQVSHFNFQEEFFETGLGTDNNISISGGNDKTRYFVSGSYLNNEGIIKNTDFERFGGRLNLDQEVNDWLSFSFGLNYSQSNSNDIPNGGINAAYGAITGFVFSNNTIDPRPDESGVYPVVSLLVPRTNPLEATDRFQFQQKTNRTITNLGLKASPIENLLINYRFGLDYYNQSATGFIPVGNTSPEANGFATRGDANVTQYNSDLDVSYRAALSDNITSTTVVGGTYQNERFERIGLTSNRLSPTVQTATGGTIIGQVDSRAQVAYWGGFVQQTFGISDKLFLTGALRLDGASVFGEDDRNQLFGKASASYVLSDEQFFKDAFGSTISNFKLRASWGQAGNLTAIGAFDRFLNYNPIALNGSSGVVPSTLLGNENLAPERQDEIEIGFDAGLLNDRLGIEFTYYRQNVTDLLLEREVATSTGFTTRFENIGSLENEGIEILLRATPVRTKSFTWNVTATYAANENVVTEVVGDRITLPGSFATSFVIPGEAIGVFYRQFYARDANGNIALNANGFPSQGTTEDGFSSKIIGDPNPDWNGSLINEFKYKDLSLRVQFDAVQGFDIFNWNRRLMDNVIFGGGPNVGEELLGNRTKGFGRAQANIFEEFVEDGSFVKLREIALSYAIRPESKWVQQINFSLAGRNLFSFDNYTGWDPEINTPGQSNGVRGFDFAGVPIPRTYQFSVNLKF